MQVGRSDLVQLKNLLARLADLDIFLRLEGEALRFSAPKGALTPALRDEITQLKPGLMAYLASLEGGQGGQGSPVAESAPSAHSTPSAAPAHPPLSFGQQRLWFLDSLAREPEADANASTAARTAYLLTAALRLTGHLDLAALPRAVAALARRHPVLRTVVSTQGETPWQEVREDLTPPVRTAPRPAGISLTDHLMALAGEPVDLAAECPLRVHHVPDGEGENVLLIVVHHIAADGWSLGILVAELSHFYRAELYPETPGATLPDLPCQYTDYARWQRERLTGPRLEGLLSQWKEALAGVPTEVELPLDRPRPSVQTMAGGHLHFSVPAATYAALSQGARAQGATPFMALLTAYGWLLSRWLGESRFLIGTPVANRLESRFEPLIGFFVNTLPLVFSSREGETFGSLLTRVTTEAAGAFSRQELPFDLLVDRLGLKRDLARAPLVQHAFVLLNAPSGRLELPGLRWESLALDAPTAKYDLSLTLEPQADGSLAADLEYNADCFLPEPMAWFARQLQNLLAGLAGAGVGDMAAVVLRPALLWDAPWREQVLQDWSQARQPLPPASPDLFQRFLDHATAHPDAVALVAAEDGSTRSYWELASQARQVAAALAGQGLGPGDLALLLCPRGLAFAEGLLGCLAAAVGYVPVAADTPPARLQRLAADAGVKTVLTVSGFDPGVPLCNRAGELLPRIDLDRLPAAEGDVPLAGQTWAGDIPAYVIFTSGSTGRPKGVVVGREALSRHLPVMAERYELAPGDRFMLVSAYGFDLAQEQLLTPLIRGATVVVQGDEDGQPGWQPEAVLASVIRHRVNVLNLPASIWAALVADWQQRPAGELQGVALRLMVVGAEPFAAGALPAWRKLPIPANRVVNCYGPTEIVITATLYEVPEVLPPGRVLLGPPLPGREVYVVDDQGEPLPPGLPGELVLTEPCLAMGYLDLPEETAQAFVPDPLRPGRRRYRTGDRVRWVCRDEPGKQGGIAQPMLDFLGRRDAQLKLRGLRIESGEVEAALLALPALHGVSAVAVAIRPVGGQPQLVAYLETGTPLPEAGTLRQQLAEVLPDAWLPARFEALNPLPRTDSGKVDRRALPVPTEADLADLANPTGRPPATPLESRLAELFAGVLGRARVAADANFFELGGDSIVAIQVVARARAVGLPLSARMIFRHQTVAALASHLAELDQAAPQPGDPAARVCPALVEAFGPAPLSPIQEDFLALGSPAPEHFNQTVLLRLSDRALALRLPGAVDALLARHPALSTCFRPLPGTPTWQQEVAPPPEWSALRHIDLSALPAAARAEQFSRLAETVQAGLDLAQGRLFAAALFNLGSGEPLRLLLTAHHLVVDGVSWRLILDDLGRLLAGESLPPPSPTSWRAWALALGRYGQSAALTGELPFWQRLVETTVATAVGAARSTSSATAPAWGTVGEERITRRSFSPELTRRLLERAPGAIHGNPEDFLLAALATVAEGTERLIHLESHGRDLGVETPPEFDGLEPAGTVGWFTALFPLALPDGVATGAAAARQLLVAVKEARRRIPGNGLGFGLLARQHPALAAVRPDWVFNYLGRFDLGPAGSLSLAGDDTGRAVAAATPRRHRLAWTAQVADGVLQVEVAHVPRLDGEAQLRARLDTFARTLEALVDWAVAAPPRLTPADLPQVDLSPATLLALQDRLEVEAGATLSDLYPLTPIQQGMVFHTRLAGEEGIWFEQFRAHLTGSIDPEAMGRAWLALLERHPALRTRLLGTGEDPTGRDAGNIYQGVLAQPDPASFDFQDFSALDPLDPAARETAVADYCRRDRERGIDLFHQSLARLALLRVADSQWRLVLSTHHLIVDGWCLPLIFEDLTALHSALRAGRTPKLPPVPPYRDFVTWLSQRRQRAGEGERDRAFWRQRLAGFTTPTPFPPPLAPSALVATTGATATSGTPAATTSRIRELRRALDGATTAGLEAFSRQHRLTGASLAQGVWGYLLGRLTGEDEVVFGTTVSGRVPELPGVERIVGLFVNTLPVRLQLSPDTPVVAWLQALQAAQLAAEPHVQTPLLEIQGVADTPRGIPLFETLMVFENLPATGETAGDLVVESVDVDVEETDAPLLLQVVPDRSGWLSKLTWDSGRLSEAQADLLLDLWHTLLAGLARAQGETRLQDLNLLSPGHREQLLAWGRGPQPPWTLRPLPSLFTEQAARTPDAIAVRYPDCPDTPTHSFRTLHAEALALAHRLVAQGAGPGTRIAVFVDRGPRLLPALLGVLLSGAAYIPLDPLFPRERLALMLEDGEPLLTLTESALVGELPESAEPRWLVDDLLAATPAVPADGLPPLPGPDLGDAAYIIYTSGSTGRPKGVQVNHRGVCNFLFHMAEEPGFTARDSVLGLTTVSFDIAVIELYLPLITGGSLILAGRRSTTDGERLLEIITEEQPTLVQATPATWRMLLAAGWPLEAPGFTAITGGEALTGDLAAALVPRVTRLWNQYGPTETTVYSLLIPVDSAPAYPAILPIGRPLANTLAYVFDSHGALVPPGVVGELALGGYGVADGYLGRPDLNAEKFLPDPFQTHADPHLGRIYRTGDLARWRLDGVLEYLGRSDFQVKIRGYRIELGEIEAVIASHPEVAQAVVVARGQGEDASLAAYLTLAEALPPPDATASAEAADASSGFTDTGIANGFANQWAELWNDVYGGTDSSPAKPGETDFRDFRSWNDSRTGAPIPRPAMEEWLDLGLARIQALLPTHRPRILEIGCGLGLYLETLAPGSARYDATDLSPQALARLAQGLQGRAGFAHVRLVQREARQFDGLDGPYDLILLNSVIQYFPNGAYLEAVLDGALARLAPGGTLFVGDVRHLGLHAEFAAYAAPQSRTAMEQKLQGDKELLLAPDWFHAFLARHHPAFAATPLLKRGREAHELAAYRYDVILRRAEDSPGAGEGGTTLTPIPWSPEWSLPRIAEFLGTGKAPGLVLTAVPNPRLAASRTQLAAWGHGSAPREAGADPDDYVDLAARLGYEATVSWSRSGAPGDFDVLLQAPGGPHRLAAPADPAHLPFATLATLCNDPSLPLRGAEVVADLRERLRARLPAYMVPASFDVLPRFPLTPNGKVDRKALPTPAVVSALARPQRACTNALESGLVALVSEVLGREAGIEDHFFDLGGHSLLAVRLANRVKARWGISLPIRTLFEKPVLADLAGYLATLLTSPGSGAVPAHGDAGPSPVLGPRPPHSAPQLSPGQRRLWLLSRIEGPAGVASYNMPGAFRLEGQLDLTRLNQALSGVVARHAVLRTRYPAGPDGEPVAEILPAEPIYLEAQCLDEATAYARLAEEAARPFDLAEDRPLRLTLIRLAADTHWLLITLHHIAGDGWSLGLLGREIARLYGGETLPPPPLQYQDYAHWLRSLPESEGAGGLAFWKTALADAPACLTLPTDYSRPTHPSHRGGTVPADLDRSLSEAVDRLAAARGLSPFMIFLAALGAVLGTTAGQEQVVIGTPVAGRLRPELEEIPGFFVNTLALPLSLAGAQRGEDLLQRARDITLAGLQHQDVGFDGVVDALSPPRSSSYSPLFQVMLALQNTPAEPVTLPGLTLSPLEPPRSGAKFDLTLGLEPSPEGYRGGLEYASDLFSPGSAAALAKHWKQVLAALVAAPGKPLEELLAAPLADQATLLQWAGPAQAPAPQAATAWALFAHQAAQNGEALALVAGERHYTYRELASHSEALAQALAGVVNQDDRVGLALPRSPAFIIALLAVLRLGAAYVPLDPAAPPARLRQQAEDADLVRVLTTADGLSSATRGELPCPVIELDSGTGTPGEIPEPTRPLPPEPDSGGAVAYVLYTSGSTGLPKGALITHGGLVHLAQAQAAAQGIGPESRCLQFVSPTFDVASGEIFAALGAGAALVLTPTQLPGEELLGVLRGTATTATTAITHWQVPVAVLAALPEAAATTLPALTCLTVGGEACPVGLVQTWGVGRTLLNAYGPTETTVCATLATLHPVAPGEPLPARLPIGRPLGATRVYVVAEATAATVATGEARLCPVGVPGELWIGGPGVALGYLKRPELTAERFGPDPFQAGGRIYRSGDRVRWRADGQLEFLGRLDGQIKLRGYRIEPGEIAQTLATCPGVREAAVILHGSGEAARLVAYYTGLAGQDAASPGPTPSPTPNPTPTPTQLKAYLRERLPEAMIPTAWAELPHLPLSANGKVDLRSLQALPLPATGEGDGAVGEGGAAPTSAGEIRVAESFRAVLGLTAEVPISRHANFFDLGGHSLLATRLANHLSNPGPAVDIALIFRHPTVAGLAQALADGASPPPATHSPPGGPSSATGPLTPLIPITRRARKHS